MIRERKCWPEYFQKILTGEKNFELRLGNFECGVGDVLLLREWDPQTKEYTGRQLKREITFILDTKTLTFWTEEEKQRLGFKVMSLKERET
jgi:hypothetical protein